MAYMYEDNSDNSSGPTQLGGGQLAYDYTPSYQWPAGTGIPGGGTGTGVNMGAGGGSGGGSSNASAAGAGAGSKNFGRGDVFKGTDGHYYYRGTDGNWVDSGATDAIAAGTAIAAALGIGGGLASYFVQGADVDAAQQGRSANTAGQYKLIGVRDDGSIDVQAPDGSYQVKSAADAATLPGITQSDLEQSQQEAIYRQMRSNTAKFQMGAMPDRYGGTVTDSSRIPQPPAMPGSPVSIAPSDAHGGSAPTPLPPATGAGPGVGGGEGQGGPESAPPNYGVGGGTWGAGAANVNSVGSSGAPNPYTGSTAGLPGTETPGGAAGGGASVAAGTAPPASTNGTPSSLPPNGAAQSVPGGTGSVTTQQSAAAASSVGSGSGPNPTATGSAGGPPNVNPGSYYSYGNDGTVQGFEQGNQSMNDWLERMNQSYHLGSSDYTGGQSRNDWNNWYKDQQNKKNIAAMAGTTNIDFNGQGYEGQNWMGQRGSHTDADLIASGSATQSDLDKARYNWQQWRSNQNLANLAATSRNASGLGFSALGAPKIAGY